MKILTNRNVVFEIGEEIERGRWENDPTADTYRITQGNLYQYAVIAEFEIHEVDITPEDFEKNKYCYTAEKGFYPNPDWVEPEKYYTLDEAAELLVQEVNA